MCLWNGLWLNAWGFSEGLGLGLQFKGLLEKRHLVSHLLTVWLKSFQINSGFSNYFKGYLFILLEMAPLVSLYFPWPHVFQVFKWAPGVGLAHSSSRKAALIMFLFLLTFLAISCTNAEINSPGCCSGRQLPACFYRTLSPKKTTSKTPIWGQRPQA